MRQEGRLAAQVLTARKGDEASRRRSADRTSTIEHFLNAVRVRKFQEAEVFQPPVRDSRNVFSAEYTSA